MKINGEDGKKENKFYERWTLIVDSRMICIIIQLRDIIMSDTFLINKDTIINYKGRHFIKKFQLKNNDFFYESNRN